MPVSILVDTCHQLGTDHDMLQTDTSLGVKAAVKRVRTGRRVMVSKPVSTGPLNQEVMRQLAQTHTRPPRSRKCRDSEATKVYFQVARRCRTSESWKRALASRKEDRARWMQDKLNSAAAERDPHQVVHDFYSEVFAGGDAPEVP